MYNEKANISSLDLASNTSGATLSVVLNRIDYLGGRLNSGLKEVSDRLSSIRNIAFPSSGDKKQSPLSSENNNDYHGIIFKKIDEIENACEIVDRIIKHLSEII